jgi:hypothetical protein
MTLSSQSVSGWSVKGMAIEKVYKMTQFFKKTKKEEQKLNTNIIAVTSEATRVLERLVSTIL